MAAIRRTVREIPRAVILQIDETEIQKTVVEYSAAVEHPWPGALYSGVAGN